MFAAQSGHKHSCSQRKQNGIHHRQRDAAVFAGRHAPEQQRNAQHREHGEQSVESGQRRRRPFAEDHVETVQIGEEQQTQRAFPLFRTDRVRGQKRTDQQTVPERHDGQDVEERFAHFRGRLTAGRQGANPESQGKGGQGREEAESIGAPSPRRHAKLSFDHWQKTHLAISLARVMRGAEEENDSAAPSLLTADSRPAQLVAVISKHVYVAASRRPYHHSPLSPLRILPDRVAG